MKYLRNEAKARLLWCVKRTISEPQFRVLERLDFQGGVQWAEAQIRSTPPTLIKVYDPGTFGAGLERWFKGYYREFGKYRSYRLAFCSTKDVQGNPLPAEAVEPEMAAIVELPNDEIRRLTMSLLGADWLASQKESLVLIDEEGGSRLYQGSNLPVSIVEVTCPSTGRVHHLTVRRRVRTCREAIASTFGLTAEEYQLIKET